jgi:hypothetical protein
MRYRRLSFWAVGFGGGGKLRFGYELVVPARVSCCSAHHHPHGHDKLWVGGRCTTFRRLYSLLLWLIDLCVGDANVILPNTYYLPVIHISFYLIRSKRSRDKTFRTCFIEPFSLQRASIIQVEHSTKICYDNPEFDPFENGFKIFCWKEFHQL